MPPPQHCHTALFCTKAGVGERSSSSARKELGSEYRLFFGEAGCSTFLCAPVFRGQQVMATVTVANTGFTNLVEARCVFRV